MTSLFSSLNHRDENVVAVTKRFIRALQIKVSDSSIEENLLSHPDFPSFFSISECLDRWNVETAALQLSRESFIELESPFITSVRKEDQMIFAMVSKITEKEVILEFDERKRKLPKEDFFNVWSGSVLLAEKSAYSGETNYEKKRTRERLDSIRAKSLLIGFCCILIYLIFNWNIYHWQTITLAAIYVLGIVVSSVLLSIQNGSSHAAICKIGAKSDCSLVLNSDSSHFFGISLSEIGVVFFLYNFIILSLASGGSQSSYFTLLGVISLLSLPFTAFSIYYQWRVVKSWCILCLSVQVLLWLNFSLTYKYIDFVVPPFDVITDSLAILFSLGCLHFALSPLLKKSIEYRKWKFQYYQLKTNKELFLNHLRGQPTMPVYHPRTKALVLGNPLAEHTITFITNPFCGPCAKTHKELENIIRNTDQVKIDIIFYACTDMSKQVAQHFLSLNHHGHNVEQAMAFWFSSKNKDYTSLSTIYVAQEVDKHRADADDHCQWCIDSEIPHTPFLYVNGFVAPKFYDVGEIAFLLNSLSVSEIDRAPA